MQLKRDLYCVMSCRYSIQDGNQDTRFALSSTTGAITLVGALDFENMLPSAAYYTLTIRVMDNGVPTIPALYE